MSTKNQTEHYDFDLKKMAKDFLIEYCDDSGIKLDLFEERNRLFLSGDGWIMQFHSYRDELIDPEEDYIHMSIPLIADPPTVDDQNKLFKFLLNMLGDWKAGRILYNEKHKFSGWHYLEPCSSYTPEAFKCTVDTAISLRREFNNRIASGFPEAAGFVINSWDDMNQLMQ